MINPLTWLSRHRFPYKPLITIEINGHNLLHNLAEFRKIAPKSPVTGIGMVAPVLKSNAYGHGFAEVASNLREDKHIPFYVVDSYFEAVALRAAGVRSAILIMGYTRPETILSSRLSRTMFTVTSIDTLIKLESASHPIHLHLKVDTGMHRQGILPEEVERASDLFSKNTDLVLKGLCSHLSDADNSDPSETESQIKIWNKIARHLKSAFSTLEYLHLSATDGHRYTSDIEANVSRLGLGLYGLVDATSWKPVLDLRPVLTMKTLITGVKMLRRDQTVGYGNSFKALHDMTIATIPAGYFEGIDRRLSNGGFVLANHERVVCPIIGRVSMNMTTIDVSQVPNVQIGTEVVVISDRTEDPNSIVSMAKSAGGITYEIVVHIPAHLKRVVI